MKKMNEEQKEYFTFAFNIDPELNGGYDEAFKQGDESWWWYTKDGGELSGGSGPAAGPIPDFTGATFKSLHQWDKQLLP
jgi:hypothetical protein